MASLGGNPHEEAPVAALQAAGQVQEGARQRDQAIEPNSIEQQQQQQQQQNQGLDNQNPIPPVVAQPGQQVPQRHVLLHQLLQTLRSPTSLEQQQQVLRILKSNPQLMTAFIRHRQQQQHQVQQAAAQEQYRYEQLGNDWEE